MLNKDTKSIEMRIGYRMRPEPENVERNVKKVRAGSRRRIRVGVVRLVSQGFRCSEDLFQ